MVWEGYRINPFLGIIIIVIFLSIFPPLAFSQDGILEKPSVVVKPSGSPLSVPEISSSQKEDDRISLKERVFVKRFRTIGNTSISENELGVVTAPYENREITFEELQDLRQELTLYYINKGYINSGVIVPDQQVVDGIIILKVIEGTIVRIDVEGNKHFRSGYFINRLNLASRPTLNISNLQHELELIQQDSRISQINAELNPGIMPGEGVLKVKVKEENPFKAVISFSNSQSPSIGSYRGELMLAHQNLVGFGDILEGKFGLTEGAHDTSLSYSIPATARDTIVAINYRSGESTVIEKSFKDLDIKSVTETYGIAISRPLYRTPAQGFTIAVGSEIRRNETSLLGRPFSFTEIEDNVTHLTALSFSQEWISRSQIEVKAIRSVFRIGIDAFSATISDTGADGKFLSWIGQAQWIRQLSDTGVQIISRTGIQLADDPLLPMEKFPVGGMNSVRGYRENLLVRDNGIVSSLELRLPVISYKQKEGLVQFAPFVDFGSSWNTEKDTPDPKSISGLGAGIRWAIIKGMYLNVYYGYPLRRVYNSDHDLQDEGVHFQFVWQMY